MKRLLLTVLSLANTLFLFSQTYPSYDMGSAPSATDTAGYLYDNGGPNANYVANTTTTFTINSSNGKSVNIHFVMFDMEPDAAGACAYDYVEIFDAASADPTALVGMYCGNNVPPDFTSSSKEVTIRLTADGGLEHTGFKMFWTTGEVPEMEPEYCFAKGANCSADDRWIVNVTLNDMSKNSGCSTNGYSDFTDNVANVNISEAYVVEVTADPFLNGGNMVRGWLDQNNDGGFSAEERIVFNGDHYGQAAFVAGPIAISPDAALGITRLRIRYDWAPDPTALLNEYESPCGRHDLGEVEDYTVLISDPSRPFPECANPIYPADLDTNICTTFNMTWTPATTGSNITYKVELWDGAGTPLLNEINWPIANYPLSNLAPNSNYVALVTSYNENGQAYFCDSLHFKTGVENPTVGINQRNASICQNMPFSFDLNTGNGSAIATYRWFDQGVSQLDDSTVASPSFASNLEPGIYPLQIQLTDDRGCLSNIDSVSFEILQAPETGSITALKQLFCYEEEFVLAYDYVDGTKYESSIDNGASWQEIYPTLIGDSLFSVDNIFPSVSFRAIERLDNCRDTSEVLVAKKQFVTPAPAIARITGDSINCPNEIVELAVTNYSQSLEWNTMETTVQIQPMFSDSFWVTYTDADGCSKTSEKIAVAFYDSPALPIIDWNDDRLTTNTNGTYYMWYFNDTLVVAEGDSATSFTPTLDGSYTVVVTNEDGCVSDPSEPYVRNTSSLMDNQQWNMVFYPNPNKGSFVYESTIKDHVEIYALTGTKLHEQQIHPGKNELHVKLQSGIYILRNQSNMSKPLIIE